MTNAGPKASEPTVPSYDYALFGEIEERPLDAIRKIVGARMTASWRAVPHVTHHEEADITELEARRKAANAEAGAEAAQISPLAYVIRACVLALKQHPEVNASLSESGDRLILKKYVNIGIAVDTPVGLIVPVLKGAGDLDLQGVAAGAAALAEKARSGRLGFADAEGGTFTVTSLGRLGGTGFTPIINAPEVAIMGVSRARRKPVEHQGEIALRLMAPLSLSYDHRVIDGAMAARFMICVRELLEAPEKLESAPT